MKNPKAIFLIVGVIVIIIIIAILYSHHSDNSTLREDIPSSNQGLSAGRQEVLSTQTNSEGQVTVKVTPKDLSQSSSSWDFEIVLDTHSGNLDQNLTEISILIDDKENRFTPVAWEGDPPQGHHRSGILKFKRLSPKPKSIELRIEKMGDVNERSFKWELQ
ncbi:MAG: hypothetical protein ACD_57C00344G0006 [uncultured bacterium]|uniref:Uncharacterized protein n=1 Tax=Candidatus Curtissbacteria bacterium RIFOXYA1_FULL_41_14 TaxID=1797737 RepID=A0A1F5HBY8_9BACT|nr:MAG: hypothetical protein ACD_57C00344G0006 [uncultured bacterium]KKR57721.1 MAG: hypothetical protein UT95_C0015G0024 [Candidatus Curtissbacteria bacterium GW2011_GWB1_40_28]KKR60914.1 MAG: hypothetical protein UT99_C0005G0029 [Candidatus Curtissbacteria bacterium GW2011_GWA2_40_31]KKR61453.1 MAG: hypothetical protein UU00_C0013G0029 [Microgenomates group bacterium GW2011_GWC1_40_35]KKR65242.1 MAG: hypothetical protein UU05_C0024G0009 [Candidatus Curtissbacteria bacterium GW2011_GWA1_40_47]